MLFKKSNCPVCNQPMKGKFKLSNGEVCNSCAILNVNQHNDSIENIALRYKENNERLQIFNPQRKIGGSLSTIVNIDDANSMFSIFKKNNPIQVVYKFSEVVGYEIRSPHKTTIVNQDGSRTVTPQHNPIMCFYIKMKTTIGVYDIIITKLPVGLDTFLDFCLLNKSENNTEVTTSVADELLKYKQLLDAGAITQEEFDAQKQKLLNM